MKRFVLDRYLARQIAFPALTALALLFQLLVALQLLRRVDVLLGSSVRGRDVLELLLDLTPHYLVLAIPVSVLLGVLVGFGQLSEDRELDALFATGVSPLRLFAPAAAIAALAAAVVFGLVAGPESQGLTRVRHKFDELLKLEVRNDVHPGIFYDEVTGLTLFAESIDAATGDWRGVLVNDERDLRAPLLILAQRGRVRPGGPDEALRLELESGEAHRPQTEVDDYTALHFENAVLSISVGDSLLRKNTLRSPDDERSLPALWRESQNQKRSGTQNRTSAVALHRRLGLALAVLAFAWLGAPLALRPAGEAGARTRGYLVAGVAVMAYFVLLRLGSSLGQEGHLPPWLAGQLANLLFAAAGAALWLRLRERV